MFRKYFNTISNVLSVNPIAGKEELKEKANLVSGPGKQPSKVEEEPKKPWGLGDYFEMRQKGKPS